MGKLILLAGSSGSGKTTLARRLAGLPGFQALLEEHATRPFQAAFMHDRRFALANQVDYLLLRAEQEQAARRSPLTCVQDGGLDLDFHLFTRLFHHRGYLDDPEFRLCERLYLTLRALLPPPDLVVYLQAPLPELAARKAGRGRALDISQVADLQLMETLLQDWVRSAKSERWLFIDTAAHAPEACTQQVLARL